MTTALVKRTTWMNHHTTIKTDTSIKIVQIKCHLLHSLLKHPVICHLHSHSIYLSWILPFPVSSLVESSSLQFYDHTNSLQKLPVKVKSIPQINTICCFNLPVTILIFSPFIFPQIWGAVELHYFGWKNFINNVFKTVKFLYWPQNLLYKFLLVIKCSVININK